MLGQPRECLDERSSFEAMSGCNCEQLTELARFRQPLIEEPSLDGCRRNDAGNHSLLGLDGGRGSIRLRRERGHGERIEELCRNEMEAGSIGPGDDLHGRDRIAAEVEEIVVEADAGYAEHVGEDLREGAFSRRTWSDVAQAVASPAAAVASGHLVMKRPGTAGLRRRFFRGALPGALGCHDGSRSYHQTLRYLRSLVLPALVG